MDNPNLKTNNSLNEDMLPEYDFSNGMRGKHHQKYRKGYSVTICYEDGTKTIEKFSSTNNVIILDPDVKQYFPDSESVNSTLRGLIKLIPKN